DRGANLLDVSRCEILVPVQRYDLRQASFRVGTKAWSEVLSCRAIERKTGCTVRFPLSENGRAIQRIDNVFDPAGYAFGDQCFAEFAGRCLELLGSDAQHVHPPGWVRLVRDGRRRDTADVADQC